MTTDVRDLLRRAACPPSEPLDVSVVVRKARRRTVRHRWALVGAPVIVFGLLVFVIGSSSIFSDPATPKIETHGSAVYRFGSEAMLPTIALGQRYTVEPTTSVSRGEIVAFRAPPSADREYDGTATDGQLVKRVVGLTGETIEGRDGNILINGTVLEEPYLDPTVTSRVFGPEVIPPGEVFVLGDNRQQSKDSTFFGPIHEPDILGRVQLLPIDHGPPTKGTMPASDTDGSPGSATIPDFIRTLDRGGNLAGYVRREDLLGPSTSGRQTVYGEDLTTVVGHMYPGRGFVPLGADPSSVPIIPTTTLSATSG